MQQKKLHTWKTAGKKSNHRLESIKKKEGPQ